MNEIINKLSVQYKNKLKNLSIKNYTYYIKILVDKILNIKYIWKDNKLKKQHEINFINEINNFNIEEIETNFECIDEFRLELSKSNIFLLGEMHGVKENVNIIYTIFKKFWFKQLALEWDEKMQLAIIFFLKTWKIDFKLIKNSSDGRITAWHFALLKKLKDDWLLESLICFDINKHQNDWNNRDFNMASNILKKLLGKKCLIVAWNLHTRVKWFEESNYNYHPMWEHISNRFPYIISWEIKYNSGKYSNYWIKNFTEKLEKNISLKPTFYKSNEKFYTYEISNVSEALIPNTFDIIE
jgi:hypothetical protein